VSALERVGVRSDKRRPHALGGNVPRACRRARTEREGFEPSRQGIPTYMLSRHAPSTARTPLLTGARILPGRWAFCRYRTVLMPCDPGHRGPHSRRVLVGNAAAPTQGECILLVSRAEGWQSGRMRRSRKSFRALGSDGGSNPPSSVVTAHARPLGGCGLSCIDRCTSSQSQPGSGRDLAGWQCAGTMPIWCSRGATYDRAGLHARVQMSIWYGPCR
jgi:hypothetical protein